MKATLLFCSLIMSHVALADCAPIKDSHKTTYPVSPEALTIAEQTGLKTCTRSPRFNEAFKKAYNREVKVLEAKVWDGKKQ